jgi:hypothetical protein
MAREIEAGYVRLAGYELTRTGDTNAYASGDHISSTTTAADVVPLEFEVARENGGAGKIIGAELVTNSASAFGAMRLHLFNRAPFAAGGYAADNAAIALTYAAMQTGSGVSNPKNNYIGYVDFNTFVAQSSSAVSIGTSEQTELNFMCQGDSKKIYGLLEARAAISPASSQKFNPVLHVQGVQ